MMRDYPIPKTYVLLPTTSVTNGSTTTCTLDTVNFDFAVLDLLTTAADAATNRPSTLKISEADDTNATSFYDVAELTGGGLHGFTIPLWHTTGSEIVRLAIDTRERKRYLKLSFTPATSHSLTVIGHLMMGEVRPSSATEANVWAMVQG